MDLLSWSWIVVGSIIALLTICVLLELLESYLKCRPVQDLLPGGGAARRLGEPTAP
jgi:hypothetical protein